MTVPVALFLAGCATPVPTRSLVADPSLHARLPDGPEVIAIIVVPQENVLDKNDAWRAWEAQWPKRYRFLSR